MEEKPSFPEAWRHIRSARAILHAAVDPLTGRDVVTSPEIMQCVILCLSKAALVLCGQYRLLGNLTLMQPMTDSEPPAPGHALGDSLSPAPVPQPPPQGRRQRAITQTGAVPEPLRPLFTTLRAQYATQPVPPVSPFAGRVVT